MSVNPSDWLKINRDSWDQRTQIHIGSDFYDVEAFKKEGDSLNEIELDLLGNIKSQKILHLQCHFGMDTLSLEKHGAIATGVDFSEEAISCANGLKKDMDMSSEFICQIYMTSILRTATNLTKYFAATESAVGYPTLMSGLKSYPST